MKKRLFVALMLDPSLCELVHQSVRLALEPAAGGRRALEPGAPHLAAPLRLVDPGGLHLTLAFLGEVGEARIPSLVEHLREGLHGLRAPSLALGATGSFPGRGHERVLWVGLVEQEAGGLAGVHGRVCSALAAGGFELEGEQGFVPHLTVARVRRGPGEPRTLVPDLFYGLRFEQDWHPHRVCLVESVPSGVHGRPPRYEILAEFPVGECAPE